MLLASDGITIGEKWTSVLPSEIHVVFFYSAGSKKRSKVLEGHWNSGCLHLDTPDQRDHRFRRPLPFHHGKKNG